MKQLLILWLGIAAITVIVGFGVSVRAEEVAPMTEEHIARIRTNCVDAQSSLFQLHATDGYLRVNRGQIYESISTKLMAPFNSRLVLNRIDTGTLLPIASEYESELRAFRQQYIQYEEAMSDVIRIDCVNQPVAFYDKVVDTREKRRLTHESTVRLQQLIERYGSEVDAFSARFSKDKS